MSGIRSVFCPRCGYRYHTDNPAEACPKCPAPMPLRCTCLRGGEPDEWHARGCPMRTS